MIEATPAERAAALAALIPRDPRKNVEYRVALMKRCLEDEHFRSEIVELCRLSFPFFVNTFAWYFNPNKTGNTEVGPHILYDFQAAAAEVILECIAEREDLVIVKSRDMGASWLCLLVFLWLWLFRGRKKLHMISRSEKLVDDANPDSLYWKLDFIVEGLPTWLCPPHRRTEMYLGNDVTGATITGEATTKKVGVGGRATGMLLDEFSQIEQAYKILGRTADTTYCRIFNFTHVGVGTAAYDLAERAARGEMRMLMMHWSQHPEKGAGAYHFDRETNHVVRHDETYEYPPDFQFVMDGTPTGGPFPGLRSPWYDKECRRRKDARQIAQDLDINPTGSDDQFFDPIVVRDLIDAYCREPEWRGHLEHDGETGDPIRLVADPAGPLKLWVMPSMVNGELTGLPAAPYAAGGDVAAGLGATPSCLMLGDAATGLKVAEFVDAHMTPDVYAVYAVALCRLFKTAEGGPAYLAWECQGPGVAFGKRVHETGFRNYFTRKSAFRIGYQSRTDLPGWYPTPDETRAMLEKYKQALFGRRFENPSRPAMLETGAFVFTAQGIAHAKRDKAEHHSEGRVNHSDRVIADGILVMAMEELGFGKSKPREVKVEPEETVFSVAGRRKYRARQRELAFGE